MSTTTIQPRTDAATATGLPLSWYFDPEILEIERRELFDAGPSYAGHQCLVPNEGDYAVRGGPQTGRVLVRHQGEPQLVSNVCRHRQAQLLTGCGHAKHIVCPIHNWAYDLDGCQVAAPFMGKNPGLDLPQTEVTDWNGLLFTGPWDIRRELAPLAGWTELAGRDVVLERVDEEEHELNWKAFLEVYLEDYHIGTVHPGFRAFVDPSDLHGALQFTGGDRFFCEQVKVRWPFATAGSPLFAEYQKILLDVAQGRRPEFAAVWLCLFSGQLIEWYPYSFVVTTYTPLSPRRTRLRSEYFFRPRNRGNPPRLRRSRAGCARRSYRGRSTRFRSARTGSRRRVRARRQLAGTLSAANGTRPEAVPRLSSPTRLDEGLVRACGL